MSALTDLATCAKGVLEALAQRAAPEGLLNRLAEFLALLSQGSSAVSDPVNSAFHKSRASFVLYEVERWGCPTLLSTASISYWRSLAEISILVTLYVPYPCGRRGKLILGQQLFLPNPLIENVGPEDGMSFQIDNQWSPKMYGCQEEALPNDLRKLADSVDHAVRRHLSDAASGSFAVMDFAHVGLDYETTSPVVMLSGVSSGLCEVASNTN